MRDNVNFRKCNHPRYNYLVTYTQGEDANGSPSRRKSYFENRQAALDFAAKKRTELANEGAKAEAISDTERRAIMKFRELCAGWATLPDPPTLERAVEFYARHIRASAKRAPIKQVVSELLNAKERVGLSIRHLGNLRVRLGRFCLRFGARDTREISSEEIGEWLYGLQLSATSLDNFRRVLLNLFNFAVKRRYRDDNPVKLTDKPKPCATPPGILTPAQMRRLLAAAETVAPALLPMIAIGGFAGLRTAELARLDWKEVRLENGVVEVTAGKSKTASRRVTTISANLAAWLSPHARIAGPVVPKNARKLFDAIRRHADLLKDWPDNALRHSFASYHLASGKNGSSTALELGHASTAMVHKHYKEVVLPSDAEKWWAILPESETPQNIVSISRATA